VKDVGKRAGFSWSAGPLISWNFPFNGAARARVRENRAIAEGSLAGFDKAVLTALQETQQALSRLAGALDRETSLRKARDAAEHAAFLTDKRFSFGADSFLDLLDAQRTLATANGAMAAAEADRAVAQIALFKALGGGWSDAPQPMRPPIFSQP
ncbi:MAG: TolC family protein, partial [Sphingomonadaceae bacterium]